MPSLCSRRLHQLVVLPVLLLVIGLVPAQPSTATSATPAAVGVTALPVAPRDASRDPTVPQPATWLPPAAPAATEFDSDWQEVSSGLDLDAPDADSGLTLAAPPAATADGEIGLLAAGQPDFVIHSVTQKSLPLVEPVVVTAQVTNQGGDVTFPSRCTRGGLASGCLYAKIRFYFFLDPATGLPGDNRLNYWVCQQFIGTRFSTGATQSLGNASFNPAAYANHPLILDGGGLPQIGLYYADMTIDVPVSECR